MDLLLALGISIGVLIAGWTYVALGPGALPVWAGIIAWGCFFAAGGKTTGLVKKRWFSRRPRRSAPTL